MGVAVAMAAKAVTTVAAKGAISAVGKKVAVEAGKQIAVEAGKQIAVETGKKVAAEAGKQVVAEAGKQVVSTAGKQIAKETGRNIAQHAAREIGDQGVKNALRNKASKVGTDLVKDVGSKIQKASTDPLSSAKKIADTADKLKAAVEDQPNHEEPDPSETSELDEITPSGSAQTGDMPPFPVYSAASALGQQALSAGRPARPARNIEPGVAPVPTSPSTTLGNAARSVGRAAMDAGKLAKGIQQGKFDAVPKMLGKIPGQMGTNASGAASKALDAAKGAIGKGQGTLKGAMGGKGGLKGALNAGKSIANKMGPGAKAAAPAVKAKLMALVVPMLKVLAIFILIGSIIGLVSSCSTMVFGGNSSDKEIIEEDKQFIPTAKMDDPKGVCGESESSGESTDDKVIEREKCIEVNNKQTVLGEWTYYNQITPNWETNGDGINWKRGCGVVSCAMVLTSYSGNAKYTPTYLAQNGLSSGNAITPGALAAYVNARTEEFHLKVSDANADGGWKNSDVWERIKSICSAGGCVIVGQDGISTSNGHYIVLRKIENGTITYADPATGAEGTCAESTFKTYGYNNNGTTQCIFFEKV